MNLNGLALEREDDDAWHIRDRDGDVFPVAKKGLSKELHESIAMHFANGGVVPSPEDAALAIEQGLSGANGAAPMMDGIPTFTVGGDVPPMPPVAIDNGAAPFTVGPLGVTVEEPPRPTYSMVQPEPSDRQKMLLAQARASVPPVPQAGANETAAPTAPTPQPIAPPRPQGPLSAAVPSEQAKAERDAIKIAREQAQLEQQRAQEALRLQEAALATRSALENEWRGKWEETQARADALRADISQGKIEPARWWANQSLGGQIAASISLILGGIGQAFGGGPNPALAVIDKAIDRDLDAQRADLGKKQGLLSNYIQQGHDIQAAFQLAKADAQDAYAGQMEMMASKFAGPQALINSEKVVAGIKDDAARRRAAAIQQGFENKLKMAEFGLKTMAAQAAGAKPAQQVPAAAATNVGDLRSATSMLDDLMKTRKAKASDALSGLLQYVPGTDAAQYKDAQDLAAQVVGLILEGGKLAEADLPRYKALLPGAADSDARAKAKAENIKKLLALKAAGQVDALGRAGFDTSGLTTIAKPPPTDAQRNSARLEWARANKDKDPRAAEMLKLMGAE
jgi:hypothetical protein